MPVARKHATLVVASVALLAAFALAGSAGSVRLQGKRDREAPTAPANVRVTSATPTTVSLAWDPSTDNVGVAFYYVYVDARRARVSGTTHTATNLECGQSVGVSVVAYDFARNRSSSAAATVSTAACVDTQPPLPPLGFRQAATTETAVVLEWDESLDDVGVVEYGVYRNQLPVQSPSQPTATLTGLNCGSTSEYQVDAADAAGNRSERRSAWVQTARCSDLPPPLVDALPPSEPPNLGISSVTVSSVSLTWSPSTDNVGVAGYDVYKNGTKMASVSSTSSTQGGLDCGTSNWFGVEAFDGAGNRSGRAHVNATTSECLPPDPKPPTVPPPPPPDELPSADTNPPTQPANLGVSGATRTSVSLTWDASTDNVGVAVYRVYVDGIGVLNPTQPGATVAALSCGTAFTIEVDAADAAGNRSTRARVTASTAVCADTQAPTVPTNLAASSRTATSIALMWSASTDTIGVTGYGLYRGGTQVGASATTTGIFSGLTCNTNYTLAVDAVDAAANRSGKATVMVATTACPDTAAPSSPTGLAASNVTQTSLTLAWNASSDNVGVTGYDVYLNGSKRGSASDTSYTYGSLACDTSYTVGVVAYDAAGNRSSQASTTGSTSACSAPPPPPPSGFPASYFTGPLGQNNILPPKNPGVLTGVWPQGNPGAPRRAAFEAREASIGRKLDFYATHYASPTGACDYGNGYSAFTAGEEQWAIDTGHLLIINWVPGFTMAQVNAGAADACLTQFGQRAGAFGHRFLLRIYWEFDGTWFPWHACGQTFIDGWRRTVTQIRNAGGTNVGFIWSPAGKQDRVCSNASYPGDEWVDWISTSLYNRDDPNAWYAYDHGGWAEYREILSAPQEDPPAPFDTYSARKPFMSGEAGIEEDPDQPGRKGQWFKNARDDLKASYPSLRGIVYFDQDVRATEGWNWKIDTSQSALDGFRDLATDPFFNTR